MTSRKTPTRPRPVVSAKQVGRARRPVSKLLPASLVDELRAAVRAAPAITPALVTALDRRYGVDAKYGVSKRRLRTFLLSQLGGAAVDTAPPSESITSTTSPDHTLDRKIDAHHRRQASVSAILEETMGRPGRCNPDLWERRAYLMLVGLVYERLAINEEEISTEELVALAKVLAENRRAEAKRSGDAKLDQPHEPPTGPLPERLADVVRQVYGARLPTAATQGPSPEATPADTSKKGGVGG